MAYLDLVADLLDRVAKRTGVPAHLLRDIEREARAEWGGSRPYIAKLGEGARVALMERDARLAADFGKLVESNMTRGNAIDYLAKRYALSPRWVRVILASAIA